MTHATQEQLQTEIDAFNEVGHLVQVTRQQLAEAEQQQLIRRGRIEVLQEQLQVETEGSTEPPKDEPAKE